ncbi:MAG: hypothetical protein MZV64_22690 [Ignavibacteriales bacterium]|nr:hypothetical protein [Ignavibacteriales bacterium]
MKGSEKVFSPVRGRLLSPSDGPGQDLAAAEGEGEVDGVDDELVAVAVLEPGLEDDVGPADGQVLDLERQEVDLGVLEDGKLAAEGEPDPLLPVPLVPEVHVADDVAEALVLDRAEGGPEEVVGDLDRQRDQRLPAGRDRERRFERRPSY